MSLNLVTDAWIPVRMKTGESRTIAPWQMADPEIERPDWPRADLDLACYELLIGLVYLADPPIHEEDWEDRARPDPERLRDRLSPLAPAFNLTGGETAFLQEKGGLDGEAGPPDMLFIDSAGANTAKKNADLMVRRNRYSALDPALAAMALFTLQSHAPSGGAGNRTSMRGGGPLVTLVDPGTGLWDLVWANVPDGAPQTIEALPWMHPTRSSQGKGRETFPPGGNVVPAEAFFGMPRRLQLVTEDDRITGVIQKPWGRSYESWVHPLTPHYRMKAGGPLLPKHPKPGRFDYRHWPGVVLSGQAGDLQQQALCRRNWEFRPHAERARLMVGGWAMSNMTPVDFVFASEPLFELGPEAETRLLGLIQAAGIVRQALAGSLTPVLEDGGTRDGIVEELYAVTEGAFLSAATALSAETPDFAQISRGWLRTLRTTAVTLFDEYAVPGLDMAGTDPGAIVKARKGLLATLSGYGKKGPALCESLDLPRPKQMKKVSA